MTVNHARVCATLAAMVKTKCFATWGMMTMVALWDHIAPMVMEIVLQLVILIADLMTHIATPAMMIIPAVTWEVIVLLATIWEISYALESARPIVIMRQERRGVRTLLMKMDVRLEIRVCQKERNVLLYAHTYHILNVIGKPKICAGAEKTPMDVTWVTIAFHAIVDQLETMVNHAGICVTLHHATAKVMWFVTVDTIIMVVGWVPIATNHGVIALQFAMYHAPQTWLIATLEWMKMVVG